MKNFINVFCFFFSVASFAQGVIKSTHITQKDLPQKLLYKGIFKDAYRWKDKNGSHLTIITESGEMPSSKEQNENYRDAELFAYDFLIQKDNIRLMWKLQDFVKDCPVEINVHFVNNVFQITDLDNDDIGEVWMMYKVACYGDVSPLDMKIIMYQGAQKFSMRGKSKVILSKSEIIGGDFKFDNNFDKGKKVFRNFALKLWNEHLIENWK